MNTKTTTIHSETSRMLRRIKNREAIRWYVMQLPGGTGFCTSQGAASDLKAELERRRRNGEPLFEYFAPTFVSQGSARGKAVSHHRPLLYNYVFIHASENEIFRLKRVLPAYNFLSRVFTDDDYYYPYVSDGEMENLRWVARSYANVLPLYDSVAVPLVRGDRVRITEGELKGIEAEIISRQGSGCKEVAMCLLGNIVIPLLSIKPDQYVVVALGQKGKSQYAQLGNEKQLTVLHRMLEHFYARGRLEPDEAGTARGVVQRFSALQPETDVLRCKAFALLLPAYKVLGLEEDFTRLMHTVTHLLPLIKAEQSRALLLTLLYGCTDNFVYYEQCHAIVDKWGGETGLKKSKRFLLQCVADYDRWFGHVPQTPPADSVRKENA